MRNPRILFYLLLFLFVLILPVFAQEMGANYDAASKKTTFRVFSEKATKMDLHIFSSPAGKTGQKHAMSHAGKGIWEVHLDGKYFGKYYSFTLEGDDKWIEEGHHVSDPYSRANVGPDGRSIVIDPNSFDWSGHKFTTPKMKDLIVYETHVKDLSQHKSSGVKDKAKRGKYLGVAAPPVIKHLTELGVTAIELLPIHQFDKNAAPPNSINYWGYMTTHFGAPHGEYASKGGKNGEQVNEVKQMIKTLHKNKIAVILDVVYNHTAEGDQKGPIFSFRGLSNDHYYRMMPDGKKYWNGSGCGNELASEKPMTRKLIIDTLMRWVKEYRVDGFRFDLGTLIDHQTMLAIKDALPKRVVLIAEPWAADWNRNQWDKNAFRGTRWAKWSDEFRDNTKNWVCGKGNRDKVMTVYAGNVVPYGWAAKPTEVINYVEAHDGYTFTDYLGGPKNMNAVRKFHKLVALSMLTSAGVPMIHEGQDFAKDKMGNHNSYNQDNEINWLNYEVKKKNRDIFEYYRGLIEIRKKYDNFRHNKPLSNASIHWMKPEDNWNALGRLLKGKRFNFIVLENTDPHKWVTFKLPNMSEWTIVADANEVSDKGIRTAVGDYKLSPQTAAILRQATARFDSKVRSGRLNSTIEKFNQLYNIEH
ncbi:alpha-amylase family glycosyl hydrolase [Candidatus Riflebacteria bacterium]